MQPDCTLTGFEAIQIEPFFPGDLCPLTETLPAAAWVTTIFWNGAKRVRGADGL